jgi:hypothetical protein
VVTGKNRALAFSCWSLGAMNAAVIGTLDLSGWSQ